MRRKWARVSTAESLPPSRRSAQAWSGADGFCVFVAAPGGRNHSFRFAWDFAGSQNGGAASPIKTLLEGGGPSAPTLPARKRGPLWRNGAGLRPTRIGRHRGRPSKVCDTGLAAFRPLLKTRARRDRLKSQAAFAHALPPLLPGGPAGNEKICCGLAGEPEHGGTLMEQKRLFKKLRLDSPFFGQRQQPAFFGTKR
jgi:hypothetical protein